MSCRRMNSLPLRPPARCFFFFFNEIGQPRADFFFFCFLVRVIGLKVIFVRFANHRFIPSFIRALRDKSFDLQKTVQSKSRKEDFEREGGFTRMKKLVGDPASHVSSMKHPL